MSVWCRRAVMVAAVLAGASPAAGARAAEHPQVRALAAALATYRQIAARGGWPRVPHAPVTDADRARLCARLAITADLDAAGCRSGAAEGKEAAVLEAGIRHFQARHALAVDGIVGRRTRAALNVPVARRIRALTRTMARWRALPDDGSSRALHVNIPEFTLRAFADAREVLSMRVVVGTRRTKTPAFSAAVRALILRPTWYVPTSIRDAELAPAWSRDPTLAAREGFEVRARSGTGTGGPPVDPASIDWTGDLTAVEVRQPPGPTNPLGGVKFDLPNPHDVYLHATPFTERFEARLRTFSHGCIRLEQPVALALFALDGDPVWSHEALEAAMTEGPTRVVPLRHPLPVRVTYFTAAVVDGVVHFFPDVYGWD